MLEALQVELVRPDGERVTGAAALEPLGPEHLAQGRNPDLQRICGARRRALAPERVDQAVGGDGLVRVKEERREERTALAASEWKRRAVRPRLDLAENQELRPNPPPRMTAEPVSAGRKRILSALSDREHVLDDRKENTMIKTGDMIENPVTGERIVFRRTAADTNGEALVIETFVQPHGFVAAAHVHPGQEERFEVLRGTVGFRLGREKVTAGPGQRITVPAGTAHQFWNAGDEEAHFVCEVRPALQFEQLLETMFALAVDGKTNRKGMPNLLRLAVIANAHFDTVRLPFPPTAIQRIGLALGAPVGRLFGYSPTYVSGSAADALPAV
ncbi:MAG TPA: cupin domain-containing protein [Gaiellaceae bacterium]